MNSKKVLLFSRDPGGCNSIAPLFSFFTQKNIEPLLFAKDFSIQKMTNSFDVYPKDITKELSHLNGQAIEQWLSKIKPDYVITGTSFGDSTEQLIWSACKKLSIPSLAILDHWINYAVRFKNQNGQNIFPHHIVVPDLNAKKLAISEGLPENCTHPWGNPYYDFLRVRKASQEVEKIRQRLLGSLSNDKLIVFASETFTLAPTNFGYTEKEILTHLLTSISKTPESTQKGLCLIVRPHPKENRQELERICEQFQSKNFRIRVSSEEDSIDLILASDLVFGMISQFLIEAAVMNKPAVSIQIGLNTKDPFILTQLGVLPLVTSTSELDQIIQTLNNKNLQTPSFEIPDHCMETIFKNMEMSV